MIFRSVSAYALSCLHNRGCCGYATPDLRHFIGLAWCWWLSYFLCLGQKFLPKRKWGGRLSAPWVSNVQPDESICSVAFRPARSQFLDLNSFIRLHRRDATYHLSIDVPKSSNNNLPTDLTDRQKLMLLSSITLSNGAGDGDAGDGLGTCGNLLNLHTYEFSWRQRSRFGFRCRLLRNQN